MIEIKAMDTGSPPSWALLERELIEIMTEGAFLVAEIKILNMPGFNIMMGKIPIGLKKYCKPNWPMSVTTWRPYRPINVMWTPLLPTTNGP